MCYVDLEPCEVWQESERRARKHHTCSACRGDIAPASSYHTHFSVFEGDVTHGKICAECYRDRAEFGAAHEGALPMPCFFLFMLKECIAEGDEDSERRWLPMLERMKARRLANPTVVPVAAENMADLWRDEGGSHG